MTQLSTVQKNSTKLDKISTQLNTIAHDRTQPHKTCTTIIKTINKNKNSFFLKKKTLHNFTQFHTIFAQTQQDFTKQ